MLGSASATTVESSIRMKSPAQAPTSVHQGRVRSSSRNTRSGGGGEVAGGVDAPALADGDEVGVERPPVWALAALMLRARALQRHAAGVVADGSDLGHVVGRQPLLGQRRQLRPLLL